MSLSYLQREQVHFHRVGHVAPSTLTPERAFPFFFLLYFAFLVDASETMTVLLVSVCNLAARWRWVLHIGPLKTLSFLDTLCIATHEFLLMVMMITVTLDDEHISSVALLGTKQTLTNAHIIISDSTSSWLLCADAIRTARQIANETSRQKLGFPPGAETVNS